MLTDIVDQETVIDIAVHSADNNALYVFDALNRLDRSFRNGGDGIIVISDSLYCPDEFHSVWQPVKAKESLADLFVGHTKEFRANGINNVGVVLIVLAQERDIVKLLCYLRQQMRFSLRIQIRHS